MRAAAPPRCSTWWTRGRCATAPPRARAGTSTLAPRWRSWRACLPRYAPTWRHCSCRRVGLGLGWRPHGLGWHGRLYLYNAVTGGRVLVLPRCASHCAALFPAAQQAPSVDLEALMRQLDEMHASVDEQVRGWAGPCPVACPAAPPPRAAGLARACAPTACLQAKPRLPTRHAVSPMPCRLPSWPRCHQTWPRCLSWWRRQGSSWLQTQRPQCRWAGGCAEGKTHCWRLAWEEAQLQLAAATGCTPPPSRPRSHPPTHPFPRAAPGVGYSAHA